MGPTSRDGGTRKSGSMHHITFWSLFALLHLVLGIMTTNKKESEFYGLVLRVLQAAEREVIQKKVEEIKRKDRIKIDWDTQFPKAFWGTYTLDDVLDMPDMRDALALCMEHKFENMENIMEDFAEQHVPCRQCHKTDFFSCSHAMAGECRSFVSSAYSASFTFLETIESKVKHGKAKLHDETYIDIMDFKGDVSFYLHKVRLIKSHFWWACGLAVGKRGDQEDEKARFIGESPSKAADLLCRYDTEELNFSMKVQQESPHRLQFEIFGKTVSTVDKIIYHGIFDVLHKHGPIDGLEGEYFVHWKKLQKAAKRTANELFEFAKNDLEKDLVVGREG